MRPWQRRPQRRRNTTPTPALSYASSSSTSWARRAVVTAVAVLAALSLLSVARRLVPRESLPPVSSAKSDHHDGGHDEAARLPRGGDRRRCFTPGDPYCDPFTCERETARRIARLRRHHDDDGGGGDASTPRKTVTFHALWEDRAAWSAEQTERADDKLRTFVVSFLATQDVRRCRLDLWAPSATYARLSSARRSPLRRLLHAHHDVFRIRLLDVAREARGSPIELSAHRHALLSASDDKSWLLGDLFRVLVLWRYGGVYVDVDTVLLNAFGSELLCTLDDDDGGDGAEDRGERAYDGWATRWSCVRPFRVMASVMCLRRNSTTANALLDELARTRPRRNTPVLGWPVWTAVYNAMTPMPLPTAKAASAWAWASDSRSAAAARWRILPSCLFDPDHCYYDWRVPHRTFSSVLRDGKRGIRWAAGRAAAERCASPDVRASIYADAALAYHWHGSDGGFIQPVQPLSRYASMQRHVLEMYHARFPQLPLPFRA